MKVILDVNVWISAILWDGIPDQIIILAENKKIRIFISEPLLQELENTLNRSKFKSKLQSLDLTVEQIINATKKLAIFCPTILVEVPELLDPNDLMVIAASISSDAEVIITGDLDLLVLGEYQGISIINPQDFLNHYFPLN